MKESMESNIKPEELDNEGRFLIILPLSASPLHWFAPSLKGDGSRLIDNSLLG